MYGLVQGRDCFWLEFVPELNRDPVSLPVSLPLALSLPRGEPPIDPGRLVALALDDTETVVKVVPADRAFTSESKPVKGLRVLVKYGRRWLEWWHAGVRVRSPLGALRPPQLPKPRDGEVVFTFNGEITNYVFFDDRESA